MERREEFPGVTAEMTAIRDYPKPFRRQRCSPARLHRPGHAEELAAAEKARSDATAASTRASTWSVARVSSRSTTTTCADSPGIKQLAVDSAGNVTGTVAERDGDPG